MRQLLLLMLFVAAINTNFAQIQNLAQSDSKLKGLTLKLGGGVFFSEYFDFSNPPQFDIDISKKLSPKTALSVSLDVNFAKNTKRHYLNEMVGRVSEQFLQASFLYSPFRNDRRNDFKIGLGFTTMLSETKYAAYTEIVDDVVVKELVKPLVLSNIGGHIALENDIKINDKLLIGARVSLLYKFIDKPIHYYIKETETKSQSWASIESVYSSRIVPALLFRIGYVF